MVQMHKMQQTTNEWKKKCYEKKEKKVITTDMPIECIYLVRNRINFDKYVVEHRN